MRSLRGADPTTIAANSRTSALAVRATPSATDQTVGWLRGRQHRLRADRSRVSEGLEADRFKPAPASHFPAALVSGAGLAQDDRGPVSQSRVEVAE